ncbi:hypothetical protein ACSSS7_003970 [Eimeria intestinalis]
MVIAEAKVQMSPQGVPGPPGEPHLAVLLPSDHPLVSEWKEIFQQIERQEISEAEQRLRRFADQGENFEIQVEGFPSLVVHAAAHSEAILRLLLEEFHCDPNLRSVGGSNETPLFKASGECARLLLSNGADPTALDEKGHSVLTHAIKEQRFDRAAQLLLAGVAPWVARDCKGQSCVQIAVASLSTTAEKQQPFWDAFFQASCQADPQAAKELLSCTDKQGHNCIQQAAAAGCEALAARMTQWLQESPREATAAETQGETELQRTGEASEVKPAESTQRDNAEGMAATIDVQGETAKDAQESHMPRARGQDAEAAREAADDRSLKTNSNENLVRGEEEQEEVIRAGRDRALPQKTKVANETGCAPSDAASAVQVEVAPPPNTDPRDFGLEKRQKQGRNWMSGGHTNGPPAEGEDDADELEATTRPTLGGPVPPYGSQRESPASSVNSSAREQEDEGTMALMSELKQLKLRAAQIDEEFEAMERAVEDAEEANAKIVSRVASLLGNQPRFDLRRLHGQHQMSTHREDLDEQPPVTVEGYESALLQTAQLEAQLTAVRRQLQQLHEAKNELEEVRGAKVLECREAFSEFVIQVAKNSFMQQGGKRVSEQQVKKLLQLGEEKQQSINSLRRELLLFQYQQELQQAQSFAKAQWEDEQYTPLEAMDFEQLKMENQTLNERLVERQEEARKLQAISRSSVQLAALDAELAQQREVAAQLKRERAECRQQNERIKCQTDVINSELLAADWEATQEKLRETDAQIASLQRKHSKLTSFVATSVRQRDRRTTRLTLEASKLLMRHLKTLTTQREGLSAHRSSVDESSAFCVDSDRTHALLSASASTA